MNKKIPFPLLLTLIRLLVAPLVLPFFIVLLTPYENVYINGFVAFLFVAFAMTDFFDGFLARFYKQTTVWGEILDPVADKFLMTASWISLLVIHKISVFWVLLLLLRELYVMSLRSVALQHAFSMKVSYLGKVKTTLHVITTALIITNPSVAQGFASSWNTLQLFSLFLSVGISFFSAWQYTNVIYKQLVHRVDNES